jgi:hypothetical protein
MMNDHLHNQSQLEQATKQSLPVGMPVDEEAVELREGWLAMGRALDAESIGFRL